MEGRESRLVHFSELEKVFTLVQVRELRGEKDYEPLVIIDDDSWNESV